METNLEQFATDRVLAYLRDHEELFISQWEADVVVNNGEEKNKIKENGYLMYHLVLKGLVEDKLDEEIKHLARKVALERVEANINMGDFVYNVNLGRSHMINHVIHSGIGLDELHPIINVINNIFDLFSYFAVTKYNELRDLELNEKNLLITETHKDRLAILGQMSSSFVHEFRNPLTSVLGFVHLLMDEYPGVPYLEIINQELKQLNFRITQFLHTSKINTVGIEDLEELPIETVLRDLLDFLYPSIVDGHIQITTDLETCVKVKGNANELKQVFLNILMNSIDAVQENIENPKNISISIKKEKEEVIIRISNNGPPIPKESQKIIFEPFYSTKNLGTGIGLFVCKNIITKHKGKIYCSSNEEETTFVISLPQVVGMS